MSSWTFFLCEIPLLNYYLEIPQLLKAKWFLNFLRLSFWTLFYLVGFFLTDDKSLTFMVWRFINRLKSKLISKWQILVLYFPKTNFGLCITYNSKTCSFFANNYFATSPSYQANTLKPASLGKLGGEIDASLSSYSYFLL